VGFGSPKIVPKPAAKKPGKTGFGDVFTSSGQSSKIAHTVVKPTGKRAPSVHKLAQAQDLNAFDKPRESNLFRLGDSLLHDSTPGADRFNVRHREENFITYSKGDGLPEEVTPALDYMAGLTIGQRQSMCIYRSEDLVKEGLADDYLSIVPQQAKNIRGNNGFHYVAGKQLEDGRYVLLDATWPLASNKHDNPDWPVGVVIIMDNKEEAMKAAKSLYGATPTSSEVGPGPARVTTEMVKDQNQPQSASSGSEWIIG
jgi:hypothetical protein